ncbi:Proteinase inhibitor I3 [Macleaya cordata]|uniref:Proteinase inhibitor I3 n=1 Tax=Macleaya cordata TaxID=56857 RepID=A0A200QJP4_MACCD|nr:Proteinase inhibitor I3 [Macleaya cordata]
MRTTSSFLLLLSLFLFAVEYSPVLAEPVLDTTGDQLRTGVSYYILPAVLGLGGGVTLGNNIYKNATFCTLDVLQELTETSDGIQLAFTPANPNTEGVIDLSTDVNIEYAITMAICKTSLVWRLTNFHTPTGNTFITIGGLKGNPGPETLRNWFKIEKIVGDGDGVYKLVYCPSVCDFCKPICKDIGIYVDADGWRRLALLSDDAVEKVPFKIII